MVIPFFGGVPATAAIARTSVRLKQEDRQDLLVSSMRLRYLSLCLY